MSHTASTEAQTEKNLFAWEITCLANMLLQYNFQTDCFRLVVVYLSAHECTYGRGCGSGLALIFGSRYRFGFALEKKNESGSALKSEFRSYRSSWSRGGSKWSPEWSLDQWSQIRITVCWRAGSGSAMKSWIRIRIKVMRIRHPVAYCTRQPQIQDTKKDTCTDTPEEDKSLGFKIVGSWELEFNYLRDADRASEQPPRAPPVRQLPLEIPRPNLPKHSEQG